MRLFRSNFHYDRDGNQVIYGPKHEEYYIDEEKCEWDIPMLKAQKTEWLKTRGLAEKVSITNLSEILHLPDGCTAIISKQRLKELGLTPLTPTPK